MFKLRAEAYSIWALVFGINAAIAGWLLTKAVHLDGPERLVAMFIYMLFVLLIGCAFTKTYIELNRIVRDVDFCLTQESSSPPLDGALTYWRSKDYRPHIYFAYGLNALFALLVTVLVWHA